MLASVMAITSYFGEMTPANESMTLDDVSRKQRKLCLPTNFSIPAVVLLPLCPYRESIYFYSDRELRATVFSFEFEAPLDHALYRAEAAPSIHDRAEAPHMSQLPCIRVLALSSGKSCKKSR